MYVVTFKNIWKQIQSSLDSVILNVRYYFIFYCPNYTYKLTRDDISQFDHAFLYKLYNAFGFSSCTYTKLTGYHFHALKYIQVIHWNPMTITIEQLKL